MILQFYLLIIVFLLSASPITAQKKSQNSDVPTIDFCDLVNNPAKYDKKIVRTKAIYVSGYHGTSIYDYRCNNGDASMEAGYEKSVIFETKKEISQKYDEILNAESEDNSNRAYVTLIGRFNDWNGGGYGHLNWSRFEFAVMAFESIKPVGTSVPWNNKESEFKKEIEILRDIDLNWNKIFAGFYDENSDDIFSTEYIYKDLQGKSLNKSQFLEMISSVEKSRKRVVRGGLIFVEGDKASIKESESISYICPSTILHQHKYENYYEKQNGKWKLAKTQITSDKSSLEISCY